MPIKFEKLPIDGCLGVIATQKTASGRVNSRWEKKKSRCGPLISAVTLKFSAGEGHFPL